MASQPEVPVYDPGVYQFEITDPVQGGIGGVANLPELNLANRTAWLKQRLDALSAGTLIPPTVAPLNGPAFTGSTTAPNVAPGDNSTLIANTNFVQTAKSGIAYVSCSTGTVTLTQPQWGVGILVFQGTLTGNVTVLFPAKLGAWICGNYTTGAFTLTLACAGGGAGKVVLPQAPMNQLGVWCESANIYPQNTPLPFQPVQQGGGAGQLSNKVYVGWTGAGLKAQVDVTDLGIFAFQSWVTSLFAPKANPTLTGTVTVSGSETISGSLSVAGGVNSGAINTNGNITAGNGRLRASLGARGSSDPNSGVILNDYANSFWAFNTGYTLSPDGMIDQTLTATVPVTSGILVTTTITLLVAYPNAICDAILSYLGNTPPAGVSISVQPLNLSQVIVTTNSGTSPSGSVGVVIRSRGI